MRHASYEAAQNLWLPDISAIAAAVPRNSDQECEAAFGHTEDTSSLPPSQPDSNRSRSARVIALACVSAVLGVLALALAAWTAVRRSGPSGKGAHAAGTTPSNEVASALGGSGHASAERKQSKGELHSVSEAEEEASPEPLSEDGSVAAGAYGADRSDRGLRPEPQPPPRRVRAPPRETAPFVPLADLLPRSRSI